MLKINSAKGGWHSLEANERPGRACLSWGSGHMAQPTLVLCAIRHHLVANVCTDMIYWQGWFGLYGGLGLPEKWQQFLNSPGDWAPVWWCLWSEEGELGGTGNKETHTLSSHLWNWGLLPFPVLVSTFSLSPSSPRRESGLTTTHAVSEFLTSLFIANT